MYMRACTRARDGHREVRTKSQIRPGTTRPLEEPVFLADGPPSPVHVQARVVTWNRGRHVGGDLPAELGLVVRRGDQVHCSRSGRWLLPSSISARWPLRPTASSTSTHCGRSRRSGSERRFRTLKAISVDDGDAAAIDAGGPLVPARIDETLDAWCRTGGQLSPFAQRPTVASQTVICLQTAVVVLFALARRRWLADDRQTAFVRPGTDAARSVATQLAGRT